MRSRLKVWCFLFLAVICPVESPAAEADPLQHWSLLPLRKVPPPSVQEDSGAQTPIDLFIIAGLEKKGLKLSPRADSLTLLRRLHFNLIGLPPSPEELSRFKRDESPAAFALAIDSLLESPLYGERWARHWLDLVHYAETHGHDQDRPRTNAWPYRDYVIASFNSDKPYARFVQEQIAGDVLFPDDPQATVALGFLATGPWDESSLRDIREDTSDRQVARYIDRDDIIATTLNTFASTTAQCARCHNHKFDPISTAEYYSLQAVFAGTEKGNRVYDSDPVHHVERQKLLKRRRAIENRDSRILDEINREDFQKKIQKWEKSLREQESFPKVPNAIACALIREPAERIREEKLDLTIYYAEKEISDALAKLPPPQVVYAGANEFLADGNHKPIGRPRQVHVLRRGELKFAGAVAEPAALNCIPGLNAKFECNPEDEGERRAGLAKWMTDPANVLVWRSIVNRVWQYHFGQGLVTTASDFGKMGEMPSHPELLDWLTIWFIENGGSLKKLHRLILNSAVYQQSSAHSASSAEVDGGNRLLWRMNRARLDAESVRDAILAITGKIDLTMGGPSVQQFQLSPGIHVTPVVNYDTFNLDSGAGSRRSIYRFIFRTLPDPLMEALDCPDSSQLTPARNNSVTVLQALSMLNDRFVVRQSEHFAARLMASNPDLSAQLNDACQLVFGRAPSSREIAEFAEYTRAHGLANLCRVLFNSNEFMFVN